MLASKKHDPHTPLLPHSNQPLGHADAAASAQRSRPSSRVSMGAHDTDEAAQALTQADDSPRTPLVQYGAASDDESLLPAATAGSSSSGSGGSGGGNGIGRVDDSASLTKPKPDPAAEQAAYKRKERMAILKVIVVLVVVGAVRHTHTTAAIVITERQARCPPSACLSFAKSFL